MTKRIMIVGIAAVLAMACGSAGVGQDPNPAAPPSPLPGVVESVTVRPAAVLAGHQVQLDAAVAATGSIDTSVTWSLAAGSLGSVDALSGLYSAPTSAGTFTVLATSRADPTRQGSGAVTVTAGTTGLLTVADWEGRYLTADANSYSGTGVVGGVPQQCKQRIAAGNARWAFDSWWCWHGAVSMYRATGKTTYLDRALEYTEDFLAKAVPTDQLTAAHAAAVGCWISGTSAPCTGSSYSGRADAASYLGWHSWGLTGDASVAGDEYPLYEGQIFRHVTQMLVALHGDPAVYADPRYRARYDRILAFVKQNVWNKWVARGMAHIYRVNIHMTAHWSQIGLHLWLLSDAADPRRAEYRSVVDAIDHAGIPGGFGAPAGSSLRAQMRAHPLSSQAYVFDANWGGSGYEDATYAGQVVNYIIESYTRDPLTKWTTDDIARLVHTLTDHVWAPDGNGGYTFAPNVYGGTGGPGAFNNWARLGGFDSSLEIQRRFQSHTSSRNVEMYGVGALNAAILSGAPVR